MNKKSCDKVINLLTYERVKLKEQCGNGEYLQK